MENLKPSSPFLILLFIAALVFSHVPEAATECVKRSFKYPTPSDKPQTPNAQPPPPSSSSKKEEKETSESAASSTVSASDPKSTSGGPEFKSMFGGMLKQAVEQIDTNSPILDIPKATVTDPEIKKMCEATDYADLCESTVAHFVDGRHDPVAMLEIVIKVCVQYTQLAMAAAKKVSESPVFARIKSRFNDIAEYYEDALDNLQDAANAINARDIATVNINLSAALDDFGAYEDDWGETSPMSDFDAKLTHMASNCLAISSLVKFH